MLKQDQPFPTEQRNTDSFIKPWPIIERFLQGLEPGSVGLDVGCGNGKYLAVNRDIFIVGSDRYAHNLFQWLVIACRMG